MTAAPCSCRPPGVVQVRSCDAAGTERVGHRLEQRADLGLPVPGPLDRLGVDAQGHVVDEHPAVHLPEVDHPLAAVDEGVERPDDVVPVDAEVEGEVVARPRRDAGVGHVAPGGDGGGDRLRPVTAGHGDGVGAALDRRAHQFREIVPGAQLDRLDPAVARLRREGEAGGLPVAGARIDEQDGALGRVGSGQLDLRPGRRAGPRRARSARRSPSSRRSAEEPVVDEEDGGRRAAPRPATARPATRPQPAAQHPLPGAGGHQQAAGEDQEPAGEVLHRDRDRGGPPSSTRRARARTAAVRRPVVRRKRHRVCGPRSGLRTSVHRCLTGSSGDGEATAARGRRGPPREPRHGPVTQRLPQRGRA